MSGVLKISPTFENIDLHANPTGFKGIQMRPVTVIVPQLISQTILIFKHFTEFSVHVALKLI